jgi:hypothetical protein
MDAERAAKLVGKEVTCKKVYSDVAAVIGEKYKILAIEDYGFHIRFNCHDSCKIGGLYMNFREIEEYFDYPSLDTLSERIKDTLLNNKPFRIKDLLT